MFKSITLEISLKPFKKTDDEYIRKICAGIFEQWKPLIKNRETVSIMLWVADGSEILDYNRNLEDTFEWCRFIGTANLPYLSEDEPKETSLHKRKQDYIENAPVMNYGILKKIITCLKEEGEKALPNSKIRVGETFDIGPEFSISDFKYNRHKEICSGSKLDKLGFVDATAPLNADTRSYAAYPNGIPEGTRFGTFLGAQAKIFLKDMGFDYLWLSNGLGFSANPWDMTGKIFDGEDFYPEKLDETKHNVFEFWNLFRKECPDIPLETRGTNNSVGIDYATDGVPLYDIYNADFNILPPPNSPWAAINNNYGLEIMGHMTRICNLPKNEFMFRYYIHDPWWCNSPWYDRYEGAPGDIYMPMSISRIDENGETNAADCFNILSIDNSFGDLPDACVYEPLPHILKAEKNAPDEPAPLVWVYPMREYTTTKDKNTLKEMYYGDRYIENAINNGFPLCCVVSTDNFQKHTCDLYKKSVLISPVPKGETLEKLESFAQKGGKVIVYGFKDELKNPQFQKFLKADIEKNTDELLKLLGKAGYSIKHKQLCDCKPTNLTISKSDNGFFFSVYNYNTTNSIQFKFPLGAPILIGGETVIENGCSTYNFNRGEHRECRVYIKQKKGVVSLRETPPVSGKYRRRITLTGLEDATVYFFPESYCIDTAKICFDNPNEDHTPLYDENFKLVKDDENGCYYKAEHISGGRALLMPFKNK